MWKRLLFYGLAVSGTLMIWFFEWLGNIITHSMSPAVTVQAVIVWLALLFTIGAIADRRGNRV